MLFNSLDFALFFRVVFAIYIFARFAAAEFPSLTNPDEEWHTRDGTHLMPESGKRYSRWLREQIDRLLGDSNSR